MVQELEKIRLEWAKRDTYLRHFDLAPIKMTEWFSARPLFSSFHHAPHSLPSVNKTPTKALRATGQQKSSCWEGTLRTRSVMEPEATSPQPMSSRPQCEIARPSCSSKQEV